MKLGELKYSVNDLCKRVAETGSNSDTFLMYALCALYYYSGGKQDLTKAFQKTGLLGRLPNDRARQNFTINYTNYVRAITIYLILKDCARRNYRDYELPSIKKMAEAMHISITKMKAYGVEFSIRYDLNYIQSCIKVEGREYRVEAVITRRQDIDKFINDIVTKVCSQIRYDTMLCTLEKVMSWNRQYDDLNILRLVNN